MKTLLLMTLIAGAALAAPSGTLIIHLHDSSHGFTYKAPVNNVPENAELASHLDRARRQMANELGYTEKLYGPDHHKVLGAVRVSGAWLEGNGRKTALGAFRAQERRGDYGE